MFLPLWSYINVIKTSGALQIAVFLQLFNEAIDPWIIQGQ